MAKIAVLMFGPPGSGKGTQANLLARKLDLVHFDTGHFLEKILHDPARQKEKSVVRRRQEWDAGKLVDPEFVTREVSKEVRHLAAADWSLVFSGSPRTVYETERVMPLLRKLYGKNIFIFILQVPPRVSIVRNSKRLVCKFCGYGLLSRFYPVAHPKHCPVCGGQFYRRGLDNPKTIKVRLKQYTDRTKPIFNLMQRKGFKLHRVSGLPAPYKTFQTIYAKIKNAR